MIGEDSFSLPSLWVEYVLGGSLFCVGIFFLVALSCPKAEMLTPETSSVDGIQGFVDLKGKIIASVH